MGKQQKAVPAVIDVDAADKWPAASTITEQCIRQTVKGPIAFKLRAISVAEWDAIWAATPDPEPPTVTQHGVEKPNPEDKNHKRALADAAFARLVAIVDRCWQPLPGETLAAKVAWASEHLQRGGEIASVSDAIIDLSGFRRGGQEAEPTSTETPVEVGSPEEWAKSTEAGAVFTFAHGAQTLRFSLRGVSNAKIKSIETATEPGPPPLTGVSTSNIPGRRSTPQPNPDDPGYRARCDGLRKIADALLIEAACGFVLPGKNDEKAAWLCDRPMWEVHALLQFIRNRMVSYNEYVRF